MKGPVRWGLILGVGVAVLNVVFALAGWHRVYEMTFAFLAAAILLNAVTVVLCLREQAATESWAGQVKNGLIVGLVASVLVFVASYLVTAVVFPDYFAEMAEGYRSTYEQMNLSEAEVNELVAATAATSSSQAAFSGVVGTLGTSLVVAAIAGLWLRKKEEEEPDRTV